MSEAYDTYAEEPRFLPGPAFAGGAGFQESLGAFLEEIGSRSLKEFAAFWLAAAENSRPPSWQDLAPHRRPDLLASSNLLERPGGTNRIFIRFLGSNLVDALDGEFTNIALDKIDQGWTYRRWTACCDYSFENNALSAVEFDLGFSGKEFRKATGVLFPLHTGSESQQLLGFALWRS